MGRLGKKTLLTAGIIGNWFALSALGAETVPANQMFPDTTQALVSLPDTPAFLELWQGTELGKLALNDKLVPFWETQRQELQSRFSEAGWQMNLQANDLEQLSAGQTSIGWIAREGEKPYSIAMVIDVDDRTEEANRFLTRIDQQLKARKGTSKTWNVDDLQITKYLVPSPSHEQRLIESNYGLRAGQLIITDDEQTMKELLASQSGDKKDSLANSELYQEVHAKVQGDGPGEVEYFVRPLGIAKLFRVIGGKPLKNQQDLLKLLDDQGFGALECAVGHVHLGGEEFDLFHHGFVKLKKPVKKGVEILDFPNVETLQPPVWLSKDSVTINAFSWNIQEAFPKFEPIVDAYLDPERPGTFNEIMEGIRDDIQGPQIDIPKEVLPFLSSEFFIATEIVKPITTESKRSLVLLKLKDPEKKLNRVMDRYARNEANGEPLDVEGYRIWSFKNEEEIEIELDFGNSTSAPGSNNSDDEEEEGEEPLLDQWAISIVDGYFVFGSDAELIKELIERVKAAPTESDFLKEADVERVTQIMDAISANEPSSAVQINRPALSFEMQYELFRAGQLNASRSVLAALLDRLLDPKHKNRDREQKLDGSDLPPFDEIRSYFMPTGSVVHTEEDGWKIQSFVLRKKKE